MSAGLFPTTGRVRHRPRCGSRRRAAAVAFGSRLLASAGFSAWLVSRLPVQPGSRLEEAARFFAFDTPKVLMLLTLVVFGMGVVRSFFSPERTRALLAGRREGFGNVAAAALGVVTPFCSCSAVPLFVGFVSAGRAARRHLFVPDRGADGQRGRARAPVGPCRLEGRR